MKNNCYMTLVTDESFLPCVIRNNERLKYLKSKYPYIVLIPKGNKTIQRILNNHQILFKEIIIEKFNSTINSYYNDTINKFKTLLYTEFNAICYLDADIILFSHFDEYFDILNHKPFTFFSIYRKNEGKVIAGEIFFTTPNISFYNYIMSIYYLKNDSNINTDEKMITSICLPLIKQQNFNNIPFILHFSGQKKPWKGCFLPFFQDFFYNMPLELFNQYVDNHSDDIIFTYTEYFQNNIINEKDK